MRIFITGIAGFVASNVAIRLHNEGHIVYGVDNLKFGDRNNLPSYINWGAVDMDSISQEEYNNYDILLHMACDNIIYSQDNPLETFKTNSIKSISVINKFIGKIIYTSTASVYGNANEIPTKETCQIQHRNAYDMSKYVVEQYLKIRGDYTTLRLSNVYGRNQRPSNMCSGIIGKLINAAINEEEFNVYGDGLDTRDYTYIDDVVSAILIAVYKKPLNTEINISTGIETSIYDLINIVEKHTGNVVLIKNNQERSIDGINRRCLDNSRANYMLGWKPFIDIKTGIKKTTDWINENY